MSKEAGKISAKIEEIEIWFPAHLEGVQIRWVCLGGYHIIVG